MPLIPFKKKDQYWSIAAGFFIGLLFLPILKTAQPSLYEKLNFLLIPFFTIATPLGLFLALQISQKFSPLWQIAKFGIAGILNTFVDLSFLSLAVFISNRFFSVQSEDTLATFLAGAFVIKYYTLYKSFSFLLANLNSFFWNKYWTFEKKDGAQNGSQFIQFFTVSIIGFVLNITVSSTVFSLVPADGLTSGQWGLVGALAGVAAGLVWNFLGYKFIVFKK